MLIEKVTQNGEFAPVLIASTLRTTVDEVAETAGFKPYVFHRKDRISSDTVQRRLRELVEVMTKLRPRFESDLITYAWVRSAPLPGFGGRTAMQLVREGKAKQVLDFVDAVDAGVYA